MALHAHRARARLAGSLEEAEPDYVEAVAGFRELELPFWRAVSQVEYAEALTAGGTSLDVDIGLFHIRIPSG